MWYYNNTKQDRPLQVIVDEYGNVVTVIYADQFKYTYGKHQYYRKYNRDMSRVK